MWHNIRLLNLLANTLLCLCLPAFLFAGLWYFSQRPMFDIQSIVIKNAESGDLKRVNELVVKTVVLPKIEKNFFAIDLDSAKETFESVPWVRRAEVRRSWPNKLEVTIEEYVPIGTWGDNQLMSDGGEVFTANIAEAEDGVKLIEFNGPIGRGDLVFKRYLELQDLLKDVKLKPISLKLSKNFFWSAKMMNGMTVRFGREGEGSLSWKDLIKRFISLYPRLTKQFGDNIVSVDLRYANGLALKTAGGAAVVDQGR